MTIAEKEVLRRMQYGWKAIINKKTFYVVFVRGDKTWVPRGVTGRTVANLMSRGLLDFEKKPGAICGLVRRKP